MKKKFFFSTVLITLIAGAFFSCNDDDPDKGGETGTPVTVSEASALVNSAYLPLQWLCSYYTVFAEGATEVLAGISGGGLVDPDNVSRLDIDEYNAVIIELFDDPYISIGTANLAIAQITASPLSADLTQADKDLLIARAKFIRGHEYFKLVQAFGEIPLILDETTAAGRERASIDAVYEQIIKDFTEAAEYLPEYTTAKSEPSQGAVNTILAKVYLTWGQKPLTYEQVQTIANTKSDPASTSTDASKLGKAIDYANKVINSNKYQLLTNYNKIWGAVNENNDEVIFSVRHDGDGIDGEAGGMGNHQTHCGYTWPGDARQDPHLSYSDIALENRIPSNNDSRKLFSYATSITFEDGTVDKLTWPISVVRNGKWIHRASYDGPDYKATKEQPNNIDRIEYRYAEVLLIKAEALLFLGRDSEALTLVNQVRARAFGGSSGALTTLTKEDLYNEWDYEFAFEQKHWYNLVRWKNYVSTVENAINNFEYYKDTYADANSIKAAFPDVANEVNAPFYVKLHDVQRAKLANLKGKLYRLPIPATNYEGEVLNITPQNPGY
ncbi:MAG: RagB/SusD family nutrient uptake outer membrane protein [Dysgonamonadaceae bacterium]|jgi:hypothetical protein|nr:RagB/SusD family nutrient uptake outer membrane protein [Dysgonamonadaceae bacterium]